MLNCLIILFLALFLPIVSLHASLYENGKNIYETKCSQCHSNTDSQSTIPSLFNQEKSYLIETINRFKMFKRQDNIMNTMPNQVKNLNDTDIQSVSLWLSAQDRCLSYEPNYIKNINLYNELSEEGEKIVRKFNCDFCHSTNNKNAPNLYGQKKNYLKNSLIFFKSSKLRSNSFMNNYAEQLSEKEIEAVSEFYSVRIKMRFSCQQ